MNSRIKRVRDFWNRMAEDGSDEVSAIDRTVESLGIDGDRILGTLPLTSDSDVLDLCCGNGLLSLPIAEVAHRVIGLDNARSLLRMGRRGIGHRMLSNIDFIEGEAISLPFKDNSFDAVFCYDAFHYFPDYKYARHVMEEIIRVTKPTGAILLTKIPAKDSMGYLLWNLIRSRRKGYEAPLPIRRGSRSPLERLSLLFRRLTGKRVDSDEWLWYEKSFFEGFKENKFGRINMLPYPQRKRLNYRFDVLLANK